MINNLYAETLALMCNRRKTRQQELNEKGITKEFINEFINDYPVGSIMEFKDGESACIVGPIEEEDFSSKGFVKLYVRFKNKEYINVNLKMLEKGTIAFINENNTQVFNKKEHINKLLKTNKKNKYVFDIVKLNIV